MRGHKSHKSPKDGEVYLWTCALLASPRLTAVEALAFGPMFIDMLGGGPVVQKLVLNMIDRNLTKAERTKAYDEIMAMIERKVKS